ncbi:Uncharacterized protein dnl_12370 [Desulfonema limicola]|uniref:Uncharacterized protein n=1 Tax=Desulfonema limicola TaxID=45656 RepID=A0A975GFA7_9BACT|nr:Uncharacterized protein dnl_12370 [Desulfonema limicola]
MVTPKNKMTGLICMFKTAFMRNSISPSILPGKQAGDQRLFTAI